ncbi:MAG TPA: zinc ribbon domain-containing protein [Gemmatimonadaceae bacterium]
MPTYDYRCPDCGERFEAMRRIAQRADAPPCPRCASQRTELAVSAPFVAGGSATGSSGGGSCCGGSSGFG